jgi:hypothetical protein
MNFYKIYKFIPCKILYKYIVYNMAQRIVQFIVAADGNPTAQATFETNLTSALSLAGYDVSNGPTSFLRYYSLSTTYETMLTDFTTIVTANYPSGVGLSVYLYDYDYVVGYNY